MCFLLPSQEFWQSCLLITNSSSSHLPCTSLHSRQNPHPSNLRLQNSCSPRGQSEALLHLPNKIEVGGHDAFMI